MVEVNCVQFWTWFSLSHDLRLIWKLPSLSISQSQSWTMRSTQLNSHESLWRVPYRPIPGGRTMNKRGIAPSFVLVSRSTSEKRGREPVYAHGDIDVNLEDPDSDRHGKRASGRIVVHWSSSAHYISTCEKGPTNQQEGAGGKQRTAAISAIRS